MKHASSFAPVRLAGLLGLGLWIAGCSNPQEDVRVTLCKDMVVSLLGASQNVTWQETSTQVRGRESAAIRVNYAGPGGNGQAICHYRYDAVDDTALALSDPLSAFSTSPSNMTLNGRTLSRPELAEAVKAAMLKQGGELVDRLKKGFQ